MDDYKVLIYIFGIIIYAIYMAMRKYFNPENDHPAENKPARPEVARPAFETQKQPTQSASPAAGPAPTFEEMMRRLGKPANDTTRQNIPKPVKTIRETSTQKAEKAKQMAEDVRELAKTVSRERSLEKIDEYVSRKSRPVVNYDEQPVRLRESLLKESSFRGLDKPVEVRPNYAALLKDPASARTAFVMAEIFKRKEW